VSATRPAILLMGDSLEIGGTEGQFVEVACRLDRSRWDVHVSCVRAVGPLGTKLQAAGVQAWSCGRGSLKPPRSLAAVWGLARYLRTHRIRLVHSFDFYSNILGVPAARLARVSVVIASQRDLGNLRPGLECRVHRIVLALADHVLINSQVIAERLRLERAALPGRTILVSNGVDLARFSPALWRTRRPLEPVTVGTLLNLRPEKGIMDFVRAAALVREQCPHSRFLIWGEGPLRPDLEKLIHQLGLGGTVELRGPTDTPEVALRELDIFVLPSHSEACSNALLEAMATRLAVVATRVGGNPGIVEDAKTGLLVPPDDPPALARAISSLIEKPALAAALAARGQDRVRTEFSIDQMLARIEAVYDRLLTEEID
jgi:glycosyltransferase involved in cell wall biosynthesis